MLKKVSILILCCIVSLILGCGQTGGLYLPEQNSSGNNSNSNNSNNNNNNIDNQKNVGNQK